MPACQSAELAHITGGEWHLHPPQCIRGFHFDTRRIQAGHCFVALPGAARDGHDFLADAMERGASCALTGRVVNCRLPQLVVRDPLTALAAIATAVRARFTKPVVGITGSCGKTSTKEMLRLLLGRERTHATAGNWNNRIGVPMSLFELDSAQHDFAVIEAGINQPGEMVILGGMIQAELSVLTNIGPAHLELLGSLDGIAAEKSQLAHTARADSPLILPAAALQHPALAALAARCTAVRFEAEAVPSGVRQVVDCRIEAADSGHCSNVWLAGRAYRVRSSSRGIAQNAALALIAARLLGIADELLAERLSHWQPADTRGRTLAHGGCYYYIDCYNANPVSMADSLRAFQQSAPTAMPRCYLLGAMNELGPAAESFHRIVGGELQLLPADAAVFIGPAALTAAYRQGALDNGGRAEQIICAETVAAVQSMVADFKGAFFLKGSRSYQLEKLLPESVH